eukprot:10115418-Alexandrium_andersonii.AAC.1
MEASLDRPNGDRRLRPDCAQDPPDLDGVNAADRGDEVGEEDGDAADGEQEPAAQLRAAEDALVQGEHGERAPPTDRRDSCVLPV